jgi:hypothetical protein
MVDVAAFVRDGFVKLEQPWLRETADAARALLWRSIPGSPTDPSTWTDPVVWTADLSGAGPFRPLAHGPDLTDALNDICGAGGWLPRNCLGNIPIRFPARPGVDDRGWHVDANTPCSDGSWMVSGRPHTMLILTLLSEVGHDDAPTRIRMGSHHDVVSVLDGRPAASAAELGPLLDEASTARPVAYATGSPGDVYLVHPFCVHAADEHRGANPRFMSQAPVLLTEVLTPQTESALADVWRAGQSVSP